MAKKDQLTGRGPMTGHNVSHANNKTKRRWLPNLRVKRVWVPDLNRFVRLRVTTRTLRSIDKLGVATFLRKNGLGVADLC